MFGRNLLPSSESHDCYPGKEVGAVLEQRVSLVRVRLKDSRLRLGANCLMPGVNTLERPN